jgi:hypothetical protein
MEEQVSHEQAWNAVVISKSRGLLDGSNLYRRVTVRHNDGREEKVRVPRDSWKQIEVGDRLVKEAGEHPRRA